MRSKVLLLALAALVLSVSAASATCPTTECKAGICAGDVNLDGQVDLSDLMAIVNCVQYDECPIIEFLGSVDGDCDCDEADLDYMVEYMFNGGPAPVCPCGTDLEE